jgi:hypothetical protein
MAWKYRWQWQQIVVDCRQSCINKYVQPRCTPELQNAFESMLDFIIASPSPVLHSSVGGCNEYACRTWKDTCPATIYRVQQRFKLCRYMCIQSPEHAFHRLLKGHDQNNSSLKRSAMNRLRVSTRRPIRSSCPPLRVSKGDATMPSRSRWAISWEAQISW